MTKSAEAGGKSILLSSSPLFLLLGLRMGQTPLRDRGAEYPVMPSGLLEPRGPPGWALFPAGRRAWNWSLPSAVEKAQQDWTLSAQQPALQTSLGKIKWIQARGKLKSVALDSLGGTLGRVKNGGIAALFVLSVSDLEVSSCLLGCAWHWHDSCYCLSPMSIFQCPSPALTPEILVGWRRPLGESQGAESCLMASAWVCPELF